MRDDALQTLLAEIAAPGQAADARTTDRAHRWLNLEPDAAQLLSILVASSRRKQILELGTSNGYSTLCLAAAVCPYGGQITSIEREQAKQDQARQHLQQVDLAAVVDLQLGEATAVVAALAGPFDCVFFDADRSEYPALLAALLPKLTADCLLVADNVLSHPEQIAPYLAAIAALPEFTHIVVSVGKGLSIAYRAGNSA